MFLRRFRSKIAQENSELQRGEGENSNVFSRQQNLFWRRQIANQESSQHRQKTEGEMHPSPSPAPVSKYERINM